MRPLLAALLLLFAGPAQAAFDRANTSYARALQRHVREGRVDYAALKADPRDLESYLEETAAVPESEFRAWSAGQQVAFLINVYNARTLKLVIDHYPVSSIKDIGGLLKGPWKQPVVKLFGDDLTLDDVEHGILRKDYAEPRVHFALVCAAKGCPPLRGEPYDGARLDEQLEEQGRAFLAQTDKNRVDHAARLVRLSPIFDWFEEDFVRASGSVLAFVAPYFRDPKLAGSGYVVKFTDYDWSLNDR